MAENNTNNLANKSTGITESFEISRSSKFLNLVCCIVIVAMTVGILWQIITTTSNSSIIWALSFLIFIAMCIAVVNSSLQAKRIENLIELVKAGRPQNQDNEG